VQPSSPRIGTFALAVRRRAALWGITLALTACSGDSGRAKHQADAGPPSGLDAGPIGDDSANGDSGADASVPPCTCGHPFGAHTFGYASGAIFPSGGQSALDAATGAFYDAWKSKYLVQACGAGRWYVATNADGSGGGGMDPNSITVSEGHGYGMLVAALMAGHDPDARSIFDGLYLFFRDHPSVNSSDLMAWNQVKGCADSPNGGNDSASDGDYDIAFALLLASAQWPSGGTIDYAAEARKVIAAIRTHEVNPTTKLALMGDWATPSDPNFYYGTRSSDFMMDHFRAFRAASGDATWGGVVDAHYALVKTMQSTYASGTGLLPDFIVTTNATPAPAPPNYLESTDDGHYSWNACRVPWRVGTDFLVSGDARAHDALAKLNAWAANVTGGDPSQFDAGYGLDGSDLSTSLDNELAFVAPLGVSAMTDAANQTWLDAIWKLVTGQDVGASDYYGNSIKLLTMIVMSGNWWTP
jgi:endo-1,4-beta-D-glucanase Y